MNKKVENLSVHDYDEVEDMIGELLQEQFGIIAHSSESLEKNVEYIVGTINIVKLGDAPNTLKHRHRKGEEWVWSADIKMSESYEWATYYELEKFQSLCANTLSGTWSETYNFEEALKREADYIEALKLEEEKDKKEVDSE